MISESEWAKIRSVCSRGFSSCLHFALATVNEDGSPNIAPIGALILRANPSGFYFDEYAGKTGANIDRNPRVCILAVNAGKLFWAKSLMQGRFAAPPAIRLKGTAGELRNATDDEIAAWHKRIAFARSFQGYRILWSQMSRVRDLQFDAFEPVNIGRMTAGLW
jgi:uncharacterized protein